jgi:hypothetical protein
MAFIIGIAIGLVVGWLFLPCPAVVQAWWDKIRNKTT